MKRIILTCVLLSLLAGPLVGCTQGAIGSRPDPVTLRFAYRAGRVQIEPLLDEFHDQYPHITVEAVAVTSAGDLRQRVAQGQVDLLRDNREALALVRNDLLRPLDEMLLAEWEGIRDDYYRGLWESLAIGGQQWGIPAGLDSMVLYVNMDAVRALGLTLPSSSQGPGSWDAFAFLELANALNDPDGLSGRLDSRMFGFCTNPEDWDPFFFIYAWGGRIVDDLNDPQRPTLDQNETIEAARWYTELFTRYGVAPLPAVIRRTYAGGVGQAHISGHCGLWMGQYSNRGGLGTPYTWLADWQMLPLPQLGGTGTLADVEGYYVTASSEHPQEALLLARFLSGHPMASGALIPPRRALAADPAFERAVGSQVADRAREVSDQIILVPADLSPQLMAVGEAALMAVNRSIQEDLDVELLLLDAQQQLQRRY
jgi:ABC-type glycerol-3-phosphate transport system substrate-binding protein